MTENPKYTIIIPTLNSVDYLKDSIKSVISQNFDNYELIVSDDFSNDGTSEYVQSLKHPNIRLLRTPEQLGMAEHYEWALSYAKGEWVVILGQDDGVMPYFFKLCEYLTEIAYKKQINIINSIRAYFFWNGCQKTYGNTAIHYYAYPKFQIKPAKWSLLQATIGSKDYVFLPQMYTTSIINKNVIEQAKQRNKGLFYSMNPPDANGAAVICQIERKYIESYIPLSWVGSSPKSFPIQLKTDKDAYIKKYKTIIDQMNNRWPKEAGIFINDKGEVTVVNNHKLYLFAALLSTRYLQTVFWKKFFNSVLFKTLLFANLFHDVRNNEDQLEYLKDLCAINNITFNKVLFCYRTLFIIARTLFASTEIIGKVLRKIKNHQSLRLVKEYPLDPVPRLMDAYEMIKVRDAESGFIDRFIVHHNKRNSRVYKSF